MSDQIETMEQLSATLVYLGKMADMLEGLRLYYGENGRDQFPVEASAPIHEIRKNLALAYDYAQREATREPVATNGVYTNGDANAAPPKVLVGV